MAIYHLHVRNISRGDGRTAVAAAVYRAGETLWNEAEERLSAFGGRREVLHTEIRLPAGAPAWMGDRTTLWNAVELANKRKDARLAKEIEFALPVELGPTDWIAMAQTMADAYASLGHVVDLAIHTDAHLTNPHVHLMLATNAVVEGGFAGKIRAADTKAFVTVARRLWAAVANDALKRGGAAVMVDHRSNQARGVDQEPGRHRGPDREERRRGRREGEAMRTLTDMWRWGLNDFEREVYAEKLMDPRVKASYPDLAHLGWPPAPALFVGDLRSAAAVQHNAFWHDVHVSARRRAFEREPEDAYLFYSRPDQDDASRTLEEREPIGWDTTSLPPADQARIVAQHQDAAALRSIEDAMPTFRQLFEALQERMTMDGHRTDGPLSDWNTIVAAGQRFDAELGRIRALDAENRALAERWREHERSLLRHSFDHANDRMVTEYERSEPYSDDPASAMAPPGGGLRPDVRPERGPEPERQELRAEPPERAVVDEAALRRLEPPSREVSNARDPDRDGARPRQDAARGKDYLTWLRRPSQDQEREDERERERNRDLER